MTDEMNIRKNTLREVPPWLRRDANPEPLVIVALVISAVICAIVLLTLT